MYDAKGRVELHINSANPTVSTVSTQFTEAAVGATGWHGQIWDNRIDVPATTLDALIQQYGEPQFTKIDVEGYQAQVLSGLSGPLKKLSFEFTTIQREVAVWCIDRLAELGRCRFNVALGEGQKFEFEGTIGAEDLKAYILELPHEANSGDIYGFLDDA